MNAADLFALARTVFGEARGECGEGRAAVAHVVLNRFRSHRSFGAGAIEGVCLKPRQFPCWNGIDPNRSKVENANLDDPAFVACLDVAVGVLSGRIADPTDGSTHYCAAGSNPKWAMGKSPVRAIGGHLFFNDID